MKAHIILKKVSTGVFEVADETTQEWAEKVKVGREIAFKEASRSRSILEHNMFYSFIHFVFDNQERFKEFEVFRFSISLHSGAGVWRSIEQDGKVENHFIPHSWKFEEMPQDDFHFLVEHGCRHIKETYGIDIEEWKAQRSLRGNTTNKVREKCANPECNNAAMHAHHVFSGTAGRERSEKLGYVVNICPSCHGKSHGATKSFVIKEDWDRIWCRVLGINYDEALRKVRGDEKLYKLER